MLSMISTNQLFWTDNPHISPLLQKITPLSLTQAGLFIFAFVKWNAYRSFFLNRIPKEEDMLANEFGEEWESYKKTTPYKLFPFIW